MSGAAGHLASAPAPAVAVNTATRGFLPGQSDKHVVTLFSSQGSLDRTAALRAADGAVMHRSTPGFLRAALTAPNAMLLLFYDSRPLVATCQPPADGRAGAGSAMLARLSPMTALPALGLTLDAVAPPAAASAVPPAGGAGRALSAGGAVTALPTLMVLGVTRDTGAPVLVLDCSSLQENGAAILQQLQAGGVLPATCTGGAACSPDCVGPGAAGYAFTDGRELVFGPSMTGGVQRAAVAASAALPPAAAAAAAAPLFSLGPDELAWPLPFGDVNLFGLSRALLTWHAKSRFCGSCGAPTAPVEGGTKRQCSACSESAYPRTDPVVISVVISRDGNRVLLGRQPAFPPGFYSCLAGYLEAGESIEEAVRREVWEETRVRVGAVRYYASQPWPLARGAFGQVMIGCVAVAETDGDADIVVDRSK
jgi:hypothetical protein